MPGGVASPVAIRREPPLPRPRGPISARIVHALSRAPGSPIGLTPLDGARGAGRLSGLSDPAADDDLQLALYTCYELHYRGFAGVDARWEWAPSLLAARAELEARFEEALADARRARPARDATPSEAADALVPSEAADALVALASSGSGPSLSRHLEEHGTLDELREFCIHRSAYQLKEADPHTWVLPRLGPGSKAATARIQYDEYGSGSRGAMHSVLFARTMRALGLDDSYGAYIDRIPGVTLATVNLISMLGLHRRHRGRLLGHLALFEMTSVEPMGRYAEVLRRLGAGEAAAAFYDVHVAADVEHARIALEGMIGALLDEEPDLAGDVVEGATWLSEVEARFTRHLLGCWEQDRSSLREE